MTNGQRFTILCSFAAVAASAAIPLPTPELPTPKVEQEVRRQVVFQTLDKAGRCQESADCRLLAELAYHEARSERDAGMYAVMWVAINRLKEGHRGATTLREVVYDPYQFSYVHDGSRLRGFAERSQYERAKRLAYDVLAGYMPDNSGGALYYHTTQIRPHWASSMEYAFHLDNHVFYR